MKFRRAPGIMSPPAIADVRGDICLPSVGVTVIIPNMRLAAGSFVLTSLLIVALHLLTN